MAKRIIIVHGWDGHPDEGWFPWLRENLEAKGFEVLAPQLPNPMIPKIEKWVPALASAVGTPDADTYFVGHSLGCQTIVRYLDSLTEDIKIGGAVFVAGFLKRLTGIDLEPGSAELAAPWLETPIDLEKVRSRLGKSIAIFSDNDPFVPMDNEDAFRDQLGAKIIVEHDCGHFSGALDGAFELPVALVAIMEIVEINNF
jgi:hypothetical protein